MNYERLYTIRETPDWTLWRGETPKSLSRMRCVVKEARPDGDRRPTLRHLKQEYDFLLALDHPRVARPRDFDEPAGRLIYADFQGTLEQVIRQEGTLPVDMAANVLRQLAEGLEFLHGRGLGHGGLNAATVFVTSDGLVRLGGFIGYRFDPMAQPPPLDPTARYQAPELMAGGVAACSPSSDLYNLGFVALEMLAGPRFEHLFKKPGGGVEKGMNWLGWHANPREKLAPVRQELPELVEAVAAVVDQLVVKVPAQRGFQGAGELLRALADFRLTSGRNLPMLQVAQAAGTGTKPALALENRPEAADPNSLVLTGWRGPQETRHRFNPPYPVLAGRAEGCELEFTGEGVSAKHALMTHHAGTWWIYDLRGEAGTFVNGRRVRFAQLRSGDDLRLGNVEFRVSAAPAPVPPPPPAGGPAAPPGGPRPQSEELGTGSTVARRRGAMTLGRVLHEGALGTLYQSSFRGPAGPQSVAVRVFPQAFTQSLSDIRRMIRGNLLADQARHPHIVRLHGAGRVKAGRRHWWYLMMEYLRGGSLRDRVQGGGRLTPAQAVRCGREIASALGCAAAQQPPLFHRNVNPSCVLFTEDGAAKLSDFALLRPEVVETIQRITQTAAAQLPGEQVYRAPELVRGERATAAADVYGLAATLYYGLTGRPPVAAGGDMPSQIEAILHAPVLAAHTVRPEVPKPLSLLLQQALGKTPAERHATADEFAAALGRVPV